MLTLDLSKRLSSAAHAVSKSAFFYDIQHPTEDLMK